MSVTEDRVRTGTSSYLPVLDGVRAVSILLVVISHGGMGHLVPGGLGVTIFFVVSGYLITSQLFAEAGRTGRVGLGNFYLRRVLRLAPALLIYIALSVPFFVQLGQSVPARDVLSAIFYFANYNFIFHSEPGHTPVSILWSLSVEEHFYLFFPLIVVLSASRLQRLLLPICMAMALALAWRYVLALSCTPHGGSSFTLCGLAWPPDAPENRRIYLGTDTRFDSILTGSLLAFLAAFRPAFLKGYILPPATFWAGAIVLLLTLVIRNELFRDTVRYTLQEFAVAVILAGLVAGSPRVVARILRWRPMVYVGRLSYSLYLWHWAVLGAIAAWGGIIRPPQPAFVAYLCASFLLAALSFHLVEKPIVRLRRRFGSHARMQVA